MISFTAPNGSKVKIDAKRVVRARRTVSGESSNAQARIDWAIINLVQEPIDDVARQIRKELESFTSLTSRDGSKIWFDATQVVGPLRLTPNQSDGVVKSSIKLMGYRQFVTEDAAQVSAVLAKAGGSPLSIAVRTTKVAKRKRGKGRKRRGQTPCLPRVIPTNGYARGLTPLPPFLTPPTRRRWASSACS